MSTQKFSWFCSSIPIRSFRVIHNFHFSQFFIAQDTTETGTPRRRHRQQQAVSMMLMGITVFLMVFVPMGFQFLAALGGKAFLMAKLALLLASVNGLKRVRNDSIRNPCRRIEFSIKLFQVANSGVHYG